MDRVLRWLRSRTAFVDFDETPTQEWIKHPDLDRAYAARERGWMQTYSGRRFLPLAPKSSDIELADVAHGLAMTCRYGGHARRFYSVAEHCVLVSENVDQRFAREALLHDSAEAYIGDMIRPLKHQPEMAEFRRAEAGIERAVFERFGIISTDESHAVVKLVDERILIDEINALMPDPSMYVELRAIKPLGITIHAWSPQQAEAAYILRYRELFA
jgi:hypothetical protein